MTSEVRISNAAAFDYTTLSASSASVARSAAERIRAHKRTATQAIFAIGKDLVAVKEELDHGQFGRWIEHEFDWDQRTAERYMSAFTVFASKIDTVSILPPTMIYALASPTMPGELRDEVVQRLEAGTPVNLDDIKDRIAGERREAKRAAEQAREEARRSPAQRKRRAQAKERRDREWRAECQEADERQRQRKEAAAKGAELVVEALGDRLPVLVDLLESADENEFVMKIRRAGGCTALPSVQRRFAPEGGSA